MEEEIRNLNRPISIKEVESIIKNYPQRKIQGQMASTMNALKYLGKK